MDILSTKQIAELLAVSEATVKRWADAGALRCFRTPGGHRKFRMGDVAEFIRSHKYETTGPLAPAVQYAIDHPSETTSTGETADDAAPEEELSPKETTTNTTPAASPYDLRRHTDEGATIRLRDLALATDVDGIVSLIAQQRLRGQSLAEVFDHVLTPALVDIGERWARGVLTVSQEHLASAAVIEALARLRPMVERHGENRGKVILACPGEEQHDIAMRMASLLSYAAGFTPMMVGARSPSGDLSLLIAGERPKVVVLSSSMPPSIEQLMKDVEVVQQAVRSVGARFIVGGRGFAQYGVLPKGVRMSRSMTDLVATMLEPEPS